MPPSSPVQALSMPGRTTPDGSGLRRRFAALRLRLRLVTIWRGGGWLVTVLLAGMLLGVVLDSLWPFAFLPRFLQPVVRFFHTLAGAPREAGLPSLYRALILVGTLGTACAIAYYQLLRPLSQRTDDLALALRVEDAYPTLNDGLASLVQFLETPLPPGAEGAGLRREAIRKALASAEGCDFKRVVSTRGTTLPGSLACVTLVIATLLALFYPSAMVLGLVRLADPFGEHRWPAVTQVAVTTNPSVSRVASNADVQVTAHITGVIPANATLVVRRSPDLSEDDRMLKRPDDMETVLPVQDGVARMTLKANYLPTRSHLFVRANDATSTPMEIVVVQPPALDNGDGRSSLQVQLDYPAYTRQPSPFHLPPGNGNIGSANGDDDWHADSTAAGEPYCVPGTVVSVRARANKDLQRAWVEFVPKPEGPSWTWIRFVTCGGEGPAKYPATLESDHRTFSVRFTARLKGSWTIHLQDDLATNKYPLGEGAAYLLRVREDPKPIVTLVEPSPGQANLPVLVGDEMPLRVLAEDRIFGLRSVFLRYRYNVESAWMKLPAPLYNHATAARNWLAPWTGGAALLLADSQPERLEIRSRLRIAPLIHPDGSPPQPGDVLTIEICADDFDDVNWTKGPGVSETLELRIVDRPTLRTALAQEQADLHKALVETQKTQHDVNERVRALEKKATETSPRQKFLERLGFTPEMLQRETQGLSEKERDELSTLVEKQKELRRTVGNRDEGLRARISRLRERLARNGQEGGADDQRLARLERELERLADNDLKMAAQELDQARQEGNRDEQDLVNRKKDQEKLAGQLEAQAQTADKNAADHDMLAAAAAAQAGKAGPAEKSRLEKEAQEQRQAAKKERDKAREAREQARLERERPLSDLAPRLEAARAHQDEIAKTFDELLGSVETDNDIGQVQRDAARLLNKQRQLEKDAQEARAGIEGRKPESLTEPERERLRSLAEQQRQLSEQADALLERLTKTAAKAEASNPDVQKTLERLGLDKETARKASLENPEAGKALRQARDEARKADPAGRMKEAADRIGRNQLNQAADSQQQAAGGLEKLVQELDRRRDEDLDRLARRNKENEKRLERLIKEEEKLQKKVRDAANIADPEKRAQELKRLAAEQEQVRKETEDMLKVLERQRANRPLDQAADAMKQAGKDLQNGRAPQPEQEQEALDRLQEARTEVKKAGEKAEEELNRERLARAKDSLRRLMERQAALVAEGTRLQNVVKEAGEWRLEVKKEWLRLADVQGRKKEDDQGDNVPGLGDETALLAKRDLAGAPVLARLLMRSAEAMEKTSERLRTVVKTPPAPASLPDAEIVRLQKEALLRLEQVLAAVEDETRRPRGANNAAAGGNGSGSGANGRSGGGNAGDSIPPLAQLKLLRNLQLEVNQKSEDFQKQHPDLKRLTPAETGEWQSIKTLQKDVSDLVEELRHPPGAADEGDHK